MEVPPGTRLGYSSVAADGYQVETPGRPQTFHVWVNLAKQHSQRPTIEYPGLLLGWRRGTGGWEAQVMWMTPGESGADTSHLGWLQAHQLRPVREA